MALVRAIAQPDGVTVSYHRVVRVDIMTNEHNLIEVGSCIDASARAAQKAWTGEEAAPPYTATRFFEAPYDQGMTVEGAYAWLKANVEEFAGAADALEGDDAS